MEIGSLFLLFALTILVGLFVLRPFYENRRIHLVSADDHKLSALLAERDRLITALQELDFDHTLGKIPAEDYPVQRAILLQKAAQALNELDQLQSQPDALTDAESRIEAVVAQRRADSVEAEVVTTLSDDDVESLIAARRATRKGKSAGFCSKCGKPVLRSDHFCPNCGNPLKAG